MTFIYLFLLMFAIGLGGYWFVNSRNSLGNSPQNLETISIKLKDKNFLVMVARKPVQLQKGLMHREHMANNEGMLFIFPHSSIYPFWMKNTLIPLDIIWIDKDKKIVYIKENAQPCSNIVDAVCNSIVPTKTAKYVLEINAGLVDENGIDIGDVIEFNLD